MNTQFYCAEIKEESIINKLIEKAAKIALGHGKEHYCRTINMNGPTTWIVVGLDKDKDLIECFNCSSKIGTVLSQAELVLKLHNKKS